MYILGIEDVPRHNKVTTMEVKLPVFVMLAMALSPFSAAFAKQVLAAYYNPKCYPAACPNFTMKNSGVMIPGVRDELWNNGTPCGPMPTVRSAKPPDRLPHPCKDGVITVKVVDYCRQPCNGVINLSRDAFARIANLDAGKVWVVYA
ncbi:EG45-like domain containing protein [Syzygium oleosum]|uniref:EG45-like domain containing protein n=1 Tax=Syzygium oleosum TaxID=219896 RepID=UPI0024BAE948|nr:EG45-like domain containing protein [Syzygium oleosum]